MTEFPDGFAFDDTQQLPDWPQAVFALAKALDNYMLWLHDFAYGHDDTPQPTPPPALVAAIKRCEALRAEVAEEVKLQDGHVLLNLPVLGHA